MLGVSQTEKPAGEAGLGNGEVAKRVEDALRAEWQRILAERPSDPLGMAWSQRFARAAIEAMREPTEAMLRPAGEADFGKGEVSEMRERLTQAFCDLFNKGRHSRYCEPGERCYDCPEMADIALKALGALKEGSE